MYRTTVLKLLFPLLLSCTEVPEKKTELEQLPVYTDDSLMSPPDTTITVSTSSIKTGTTNPDELLAFSKTLKGIPYKYSSTDPRRGFDCSGFITYVFNHFKIDVPRTSAGFTNEGETVSLAEGKPGDLILFTGTDSTIRTVGHMGIITQADDSVVFIHSTSGKANGVTETTLNPYYMGRFVKVIRVFPHH
ncbi:C40 family peptidase [Chitinophaga pinensis]|uniref:NLP/P60 protein n=1 Tax=Chitinophaga pinensis (strain ATCC 43595 / DSM 2588 / LMG 13176 / NBRC 15968 / NCIMB 11800 / UQM 2034) TaxID=485918 RepID=A0A979GNX3_CHIPD|nr:C40 family peptidase [Chitinophaga pinensis]ACU60007.1 NLP/P60 protein [Chitinophaga pinensis DSM 2588]